MIGVLPFDRLVRRYDDVVLLEFPYGQVALRAVIYDGLECAWSAMIMDLLLPVGDDGQRHD